MPGPGMLFKQMAFYTFFDRYFEYVSGYAKLKDQDIELYDLHSTCLIEGSRNTTASGNL